MPKPDTRIFALADYAAAARGNTTDPALNRTLGDTELSNRNYAQAIADYNIALAGTPDDAATLLNRGAAYALQMQYARAIADYDAALRLTPNDPRIYNNRGNALAAQNKLKEQAIADYDAALRIQRVIQALRNRCRRDGSEIDRAQNSGSVNGAATVRHRLNRANNLPFGFRQRFDQCADILARDGMFP